MDDQHLVQFELDDGTTVLVEVQEPENGAIERVSLNPGRVVAKAQMTFDQAMERITPVVSKVATRLKTGLTTPADEVEVKFGLKLSADAGAIISSVGAEVNFEITLKWKSAT